MSATTDTLAAKREAFNPFDGCPWMEYFEELTYGYMRRENRPWLEPGPHHKRFFEDFDSGRHLIRLAHRRSLKTTATLAYLIACLEYKSGFHIGWIGNNETLAYEKAHSEFDKLVQRNPWLTTLQKDARLSDQKGKKEFPNDSDLKVGWLFGGIEGVGVDVLVIDDVIKEKGDGDMHEIEDWLSSVIVPIQEDGGQTIIIGTRKTPTDVYHLLSGREGFDFIEYPALLGEWDAHFGEDAADRRPDPALYTNAEHPLDADKTAQILWSERGTEYLRDAREKQSEYAFMREFCLVVQTREGAVYSVFDRDDHTTESDPGGVRLWFNALDWGSGNPAGFLQFAWDGNHLTVADERKYPVDATSDYVDTFRTLQSDWGPGPIAADPSDKRGIDDLRGEGFDVLAADNDVHAGIREVSELFGDGTLRIHRRCEELLAELGAYRYNSTTGEPVKSNDHLVDALRYGCVEFVDRFRPRSDRSEGSAVSYL